VQGRTHAKATSAPSGPTERRLEFIGFPADECSRAESLVRLARLPQGAGGFRAHHHAAALAGLRTRQEARRRRCRDREHLRLSRQRQGRVPRRDRTGHGRERQGDRYRLHGRRARPDPGSIPQRSRHHGTAAIRNGHLGGPRGGSAGPRPLHRSRARPGREAHPAALRLSEDLRGLQQPLLLLHHPEAEGRPREPARRGGAAGGREACEGGREGDPGDLPGHERLWNRPEIPAEPLAGPRGADPLLRPRPRARRTRRLDPAALRLPLPPRGRGHPSDGGGQGPALSRHSLPARVPGRAEGHAPPGPPGEDPGQDPQLA
jgi:hypothetical protein